MATADLDNTTWKLISYAVGAALRRLPTGAEVTLAFQDGAAGGRSACNRYHSTVAINDATLTFGAMVSTKMACPSPLMEIEATYLQALLSVTTWQVNDGALELRDSAGQTILTFTPVGG
jgi:heat shock protein HslJ